MAHTAVAWWRSLYWRIGVSFVLLVIGIALAQGLLFTYQWRSLSRDPHRSPHGVAQDVALEYSTALARGERVDLKRLQRLDPSLTKVEEKLAHLVKQRDEETSIRHNLRADAMRRHLRARAAFLSRRLGTTW